jgi:hypothetical protein
MNRLLILKKCQSVSEIHVMIQLIHGVLSSSAENALHTI